MLKIVFGGGSVRRLLKKYLTISIKGYILRQVIIEKYNQFQDFADDYHSSDWVFLHFMEVKNKHPLNDYPLMLYVRTSSR